MLHNRPGQYSGVSADESFRLERGRQPFSFNIDSRLFATLSANER